LKYGLSAKAHASRTRLNRRCSVGYIHCWMFVTKDDPSLTQRLWYCYLYLPVENPRSRPPPAGSELFFRTFLYGLSFTAERNRANQWPESFPLSHALRRGFAYYCYCDRLLWAVWVGQQPITVYHSN